MYHPNTCIQIVIYHTPTASQMGPPLNSYIFILKHCSHKSCIIIHILVFSIKELHLPPPLPKKKSRLDTKNIFLFQYLFYLLLLKKLHNWKVLPQMPWQRVILFQNQVIC